MQLDVSTQDAESSSESEQQALELHELPVALPFRLSQPACFFISPDVQWIVISFSSCHSHR
jgi:hypothetical protein